MRIAPGSARSSSSSRVRRLTSRCASGSSSSSTSGLAHEAGRQRDELRLPAAEAPRLAAEDRIGKAEVAQDPQPLALDVLGGELGDQRRLALQQPPHALEVVGKRGVGEPALDVLELGAARRVLGPRVDDPLAHRALVARDELRQERDHRVAAQRHGAAVRRLQPREHPQQRRLARAVGPDQPDARAVVDLQRGALEHVAAAERLDDFVELDRDGHARSISTGPRAPRSAAAAPGTSPPPPGPA